MGERTPDGGEAEDQEWEITKDGGHEAICGCAVVKGSL